jgi:ligand-binding sensor domain-containing protein/DNA-binding CsgD family transcriptional regulator
MLANLKERLKLTKQIATDDRTLVVSVLFVCYMVFASSLQASATATAIQMSNSCIPSMNFYDKSDYKGANQSWTIAQNKLGFLYFANSSGLLEFDGCDWKLYSTPSLLRSIVISSDDVIYGGMQNDFGYWQEDKSTRKLVYTSLAQQLNLTLTDDEIWKIAILDSSIYFHSFRNIYKYNLKNQSLSIINAPNRFQFLFAVNNRLFVQEKALGLMELVNKRLIPIPGGEVLTGDCVYGMEPFSPDSILIATMDNGLYVMKDNKVSICPLPCNDYLKKNLVFSMTTLPDGRFVFGTILNGLLITDHSGNILMTINKSRGLENNTVLSILKDNANNLWLGLDRGICHLQMNSPAYSFPDTKGALGSVYQIEEYNDRLYFATNQGLFYCPVNEFSFSLHEPQFVLMPQTTGQAWFLRKIGNRLFCGHNKGLYAIEGNQGRFIYSGSGINGIEEMDENTLLILTYDGMCILKKQGNNYSVKKESICPYNAGWLAKDKDSVIYFGNNNVGIFQAKFDKMFSDVKYCTNQLESTGIDNNATRGIYSINGQVYLLTSNSILQYDYTQKRFLPDNIINQLLPQNINLHRLQITDSEMWCYADDRFFCIKDYNQPTARIIQNSAMKLLNNQLIYTYENVKKIADDRFLVCTSNGFTLLNVNFVPTLLENITVCIRDIGIYTDVMTPMPLPHEFSYYNQHPVKFPYNHKTIYVRFALPNYENSGNIRYSYRLQGHSDNYSLPSSGNIATFTRLSPGEYTLQIKATIEGSEQVFNSQELKIKILPPWYLDWEGFCLALLAVGVIFFISMRYLQKRWQQKKHQLSLEHEQEIAQIENKLLQEKIKSQNDELLRVTDSMLHKSDLMNQIDDEINKLSTGKAAAIDIKGLKQIVEKYKNPEEEWKMFETKFNKTYDNYLVRLNSKYKNLTPADLKLAAYIRMNFSSKEIASLLNISTKSVEMARYRLRKKLELDRDQNLTEFLMALE